MEPRYSGVSWIKELPQPRGGYAEHEPSPELDAVLDKMQSDPRKRLTGASRTGMNTAITDGPLLKVTHWGNSFRTMEGERLVQLAVEDDCPAVALEQTVCSLGSFGGFWTVDAIGVVWARTLLSLELSNMCIDEEVLVELCELLNTLPDVLGIMSGLAAPCLCATGVPFRSGVLTVREEGSPISAATDISCFQATDWTAEADQSPRQAAFRQHWILAMSQRDSASISTLNSLRYEIDGGLPW